MPAIAPRNFEKRALLIIEQAQTIQRFPDKLKVPITPKSRQLDNASKTVQGVTVVSCELSS